jgi:rhodanese-related sulfurtransferase
MKSIPAKELAARLHSNSGIALLDVRTPREYSEVHAAGSINVPLDELDPKALIASGKYSKERPLFVICHTGSRAAKAVEELQKHGFQDATMVEGGTEAWVKQGLDVRRSGTKAISLERQVRIAAGSLVLTGTLLGWLVHPGFFGLSAFVGGGLVFAGITDFCGMGLLLARLPYNRQPSPSA